MTTEPQHPPSIPEGDRSRLWAALSAQAERADEARDLLIRLEGRIAGLHAAMERIAAEGLPRCAERAQRLAEAERRLTELAAGPGSKPACVEHRDRLHYLDRRLEDLCSRLWWLATAVAGALIVQWITAAWRVMKA